MSSRWKHTSVFKESKGNRLCFVVLTLVFLTHLKWPLSVVLTIHHIPPLDPGPFFCFVLFCFFVFFFFTSFSEFRTCEPWVVCKEWLYLNSLASRQGQHFAQRRGNILGRPCVRSPSVTKFILKTFNDTFLSWFVFNWMSSHLGPRVSFSSDRAMFLFSFPYTKVSKSSKFIQILLPLPPEWYARIIKHVPRFSFLFES